MKLISDINYRKFEKVDSSVGKRPGVLHIIEGICMEIEKVNQNNRIYSRSLIIKRILNNESIQHLINNKSLLGEGCHPENRFDTVYPNVAFSVEKLWIPENDQDHLWGRFAILDTPVGRVLSTLLDYGSIIGVSARAAGTSHFDSNGVEVLDEDSYEFFTFDAVPDPGFRSARPALVEGRKCSVNLDSYNDAELTACKAVMEAANPDFFASELHYIQERNSGLVIATSALDEAQSKIFALEKTLDRVIADNDRLSAMQKNRLPHSVVSTVKELQEKLQSLESKLALEKQAHADSKCALSEAKKTIKEQNEALSIASEKVSSLEKRLTELKPEVVTQVVEKVVYKTVESKTPKDSQTDLFGSEELQKLKGQLYSSQIQTISCRTGLSESRVKQLVPEVTEPVEHYVRRLREISKLENAQPSVGTVKYQGPSDDRLTRLIRSQKN